jgi:hypothetical protein
MSCEPVPVDAGNGCLCDPTPERVCGADRNYYTNRCFAECAGVEVLDDTCPSIAEFPEGNYGDECGSDDDCDAPYECLPHPGEWTRPGQTVCATRCESVEQCPRVVSDHCGDQTFCSNGTCSFYVCI